ncbi:MAG: ATP-dependent HslUV protease subunit HslV [Gammaproteobacteria bacterium]|jgi:ATP-dependent HslUV protease subunit HslV
MSTIVAVIKNGIACIAADSLTSFGEVRQSAEFVTDSDKIINFEKDGDNNYLGIVGSAAHHLVMQDLLNNHPDKIDFSSRAEIFKTFKTIHPILKEEYFLNGKEDENDAYESSRVDALIVNSSGIYGLYSLREVEQYSKFWAVGSGSEFALGAMLAVYEQFDNAEQIARAGIRAGTTFDTSSSMPMKCFSIKGVS